MKYTANTFNATLAILATGTTLEVHAANLASAGLGVVAATFIADHKAYALSNAYGVSVSAVATLLPKAKATKAKGALNVAKACATHNAEYPERKVACVLRSDGTYAVVELSPKAKRKAKANASGNTGRWSAPKIGLVGCKTDGYTFTRAEVPSNGAQKKYEYTLNGSIVSKVSKALAALVNNGDVALDSYTGLKMQEYYSALLK